MIKAYKGNILFSKKLEEISYYENSYILVKDGKVMDIVSKINSDFNGEIIDYKDNLIIPGLVDLHFHAPQFENIGLGLDKELLPWLNDYTFPEEAKFKDLSYAKEVYTRVVENLIKNGTTRVVLFSSLHKDSTKLLMDLLNEKGISAYVGKVNMDRNSPDFLIENTDSSLKETEEILKEYNNKYKLVKPIITPRFVPTCTSKLMEGLGKLKEKYNVPIQTHISENLSEVEWVKELYPDSLNYLDVYNKFNLLGTKTILAHCVHTTDEEIKVMAEKGIIAAHCPNANYNLSSGIMPVRRFLNNNVKVGLGTDVGAGHKVSILNVMSQAVQASKIKWLETSKKELPLTTEEIFYLATKGGGEFFGKVGSFETDYDFDALIIDDSTLGTKINRSLLERLQRVIYIGDDRNIKHVFVKGNKIK